MVIDAFLAYLFRYQCSLGGPP